MGRKSMGIGSAPEYQIDMEVAYSEEGLRKREDGWMITDVYENAVGGWRYDLEHLDGIRSALEIHEDELE